MLGPLSEGIVYIKKQERFYEKLGFVEGWFKQPLESKCARVRFTDFFKTTFLPLRLCSLRPTGTQSWVCRII